MTAENLKVKNKILEATVDCIEKEGIQKISVRKICSLAGVNVASVNYYFKTKEDLLNEALKLTLRNGFVDLLQELDEIEQNPESLYSYFLNFMLTGAIRWPGVTKAHLYKPWNNEYDNLFVVQFNEFLEKLCEKFKQFFPDKAPYDLKASLIQMISAVIFPGIMPGLFEPFAGVDFSKEADRIKYVNNIVSIYLKEIKN